MNIIQKSTPNFNTGREGKQILRIVIHWIGSGTPDSTISWFANPNSRVSAHYLVADSSIYQFVKESDTAWHAGNWTVNTESIGIEHYATPDHPASEETYKSSAELVKDICTRYSIPLDRAHVIKHSEVKATQCCGTLDIDKIINMAKNDSLLAKCQKECESLNSELIKIKAMYDSLNTRYKELETRYASDVSSKDETITAMQKQVSMLNEQHTLLNRQCEDLVREKEGLVESLDAVEVELNLAVQKGMSLEEELTAAEDSIEKMKVKLEKKLSSYSKWELFKALWNI